MSIQEIFFLSALQGVAEFLPISSSGHLTLAQRLLGGNAEESLLLTLVLHLGTMAAIVVGLWTTIRSLSLRELKAIGLALLPLFPLLAVLGPIKALMRTEWGLGVGFLLGGSWILFGEWMAQRRATETSLSFPSAFCVGVAQAVAVLPGVSRLGSTISTARLLGWSRPQAVTFSLLLAIPTVLGGTLVEARELLDQPSTLFLPLSYYLIGFGTAFLLGLAALRFLLWISEVASFRPFGYYCIAIGIVALISIT